MSQDALGQLKHPKTARARWPFSDVIDEVTGRTAVYERIGVNFFQGVCGSEVYRNVDRVRFFFEGADDEFGGEQPFPFGSAYW